MPEPDATAQKPYDALLIVGFGGPEKRDDVIPFLENVLRGRNVPRDRLLEVAEHYYHFDGVSPINAQVRELIGALEEEFSQHQISLPIYWGNRNWDPLLPETMKQMAAGGVSRALAIVLSAYSSYSSCRQYLDDIVRARGAAGPNAPVADKLRVFYNHPLFIEASADRLQAALDRFPPDRRQSVHVAFTAHSIPRSAADCCDYEQQLTETCRLVAERCHVDEAHWQLVYQSRSGRPSDPWLDPDICDHLADLKQCGVSDVAIMPVGFLSDHMEVKYDLDVEAADQAKELGLHQQRAATVGTHPKFVTMLRELVEERLGIRAKRRAIGRFAPSHDICPEDCCRPPAPRSAGG